MNTLVKPISKSEAIKALWLRSNLSYKLHAGQKEIYDLYYKSKEKLNVWLLGRRSGKSFCLVTIAIEECLRDKNVIVKMVCKTKGQLEQNLLPLFRDILIDCPEHLKPRYSVKTQTFYFPTTKSEIQLASGENGHADKIRGGSCKVAFVDEAGSVDDLHNLVNSILLPCTLTTRGKIILASTPASTEDHPFNKMVENAELNGTLVRYPTTCNPLISKEELDRMIEGMGGIDSFAVKRELFCQILRNDEATVIPEFTAAIQSEIVREWDLPPHYDIYMSQDLGFKDYTLLLFGYYDFKNGKLIIQDEMNYDFKIADNTILKFVTEIKEKEYQLYYNPISQEVRPPFSRVSDINPMVVKEILSASKSIGYPLVFANAKKDDKEAAVNKLRMMIMAKKIIIHPKCKILIHHLKYTKWQKHKKEFERSETAGHGDGVDALLYMMRSINFNRNPYPSNYGFDERSMMAVKERRNYNVGSNIDQKTIDIMKSMFRRTT